MAPTDREKAAVVMEENTDRLEVSKLIRTQLQREGVLGAENFAINILQNSDLTQTELTLARHYSKGNIVTFAGEKDIQHEVLKVDSTANKLTISDGTRTITVDPSKTKGINCYSANTILISKGEELVWKKNHQDRVNKQTVKVEAVNSREAILKDKEGKITTIDLNKRHYLDYGLVKTLYSLQGMGYERMIILAERMSTNAWYVGLSRAIKSIKIITENKEKLITRINESATKVNALDFIKDKKLDNSVELSF